MFRVFVFLIAVLSVVSLLLACSGDDTDKQADQLLEFAPCEGFQNDYDKGVRLFGREAAFNLVVSATVMTAPAYLDVKALSPKVVIRALEKCGIIQEGDAQGAP